MSVLLLTKKNGVELGFLGMVVINSNALDVLKIKDLIEKNSTTKFFLMFSCVSLEQELALVYFVPVMELAALKLMMLVA